MLHGLYRFCWIAICCENWVGFCVRNSVYHIYGSFYFSVSGFCMFFASERLCDGAANRVSASYYIFINVYI